MPDQRDDRFAFLPFRKAFACQPSPRIAAEKNQAFDPFRMACRIGNGDRRTLRGAEQREAIETGGVGDRLQVGDAAFERE